MHCSTRFCTYILAFLVAIASELHAQATIQGTVSFLNSGSSPAAGVDISAFGASTVPTSESGMFILKFPDKKPGDKVKIIVGSKDRNGTTVELVNDKVIEQVRIPSKPDDDIVEVLVCKKGQRDESMLRFYGIIVKTINEATDKRLKEIDEKLGAVKLDAETIISLQNEKEKLAAERDSALAKAEEQALYIASINLDKASQLVRDAVLKVDNSKDITGAIAILDNEMLIKAYKESQGKIQKAKKEIDQVIEGFKLKINLLGLGFQNAEINRCCLELEKMCLEQNHDIECNYHCFDWTTLYKSDFNIEDLANKNDSEFLAKYFSNLALNYSNLGEYQKALEFNLKAIVMIK